MAVKNVYAQISFVHDVFDRLTHFSIGLYGNLQKASFFILKSHEVINFRYQFLIHIFASLSSCYVVQRNHIIIPVCNRFIEL